MAELPLIVLDALLVQPQPTGVGRSILELIRALSKEDRHLRFAVLATTPEMFDFLPVGPNWQIVNCPGAVGNTFKKAMFTQFRIPVLLRRLGASLLHSMQYVAPMKLPCPSLVTVHDLSYIRYPQTVEQPRLGYYRLLVPRTLARATGIVTNSAATAAEVAEYFPNVARRVTVTPFGTPSWTEQMPLLNEPVTDNAPFLFVGTLEPRKNLKKLLSAYTLFLDRNENNSTFSYLPDMVLVGGKGWNDKEIGNSIDKLHKRGKLCLLDYCGPDQLWRQYCLARALLFPSLHEGFGFPILEAMAAGLPVVTSERGAMAEVAGDAALLVDPDNKNAIAAAMERICTSSTLRSRLIIKGHQRIKHWTWEHTANVTARIYFRLHARKQ